MTKNLGFVGTHTLVEPDTASSIFTSADYTIKNGSTTFQIGVGVLPPILAQKNPEKQTFPEVSMGDTGLEPVTSTL